MARYEIKIVNKGDIMETICAGIVVAKALKLDFLSVDTGEGFDINVSKDSREVDIYNIYKLTSENRKLKEKK